MGCAAAPMNSLPRPAVAALGHQENWAQIAAMVGTMRKPPCLPLTDAELREVVPWIPPRTVSALESSRIDRVTFN